MDVEDSMEYFFDHKKARQNEIRIEKAKSIRETKQTAWAARLQPLNDSTKQCCSKKCINGCIPLPLLEITRKVKDLWLFMAVIFISTDMIKSARCTRSSYSSKISATGSSP
jgi:hypothetical protein